MYERTNVPDVKLSDVHNFSSFENIVLMTIACMYVSYEIPLWLSYSDLSIVLTALYLY